MGQEQGLGHSSIMGPGAGREPLLYAFKHIYPLKPPVALTFSLFLPMSFLSSLGSFYTARSAFVLGLRFSGGLLETTTQIGEGKHLSGP